MIKNLDIKKEIININLLFEKYLIFIESLFCMRCYTARKKELLHHRGGILHLLNEKPSINKEQFSIWLDHSDHGFFHGFCVGFWAFLQNNHKMMCELVYDMNGDHHVSNKNLDVERLFYSCFFHDFSRCVDKEEKHDIDLVNYFPNCTDLTYKHSNPSEAESNNHLIVSDRIELHRFADTSWIDQKKLNENNFISKNKNLIKAFYSYLFPALHYIFFNKKELWIRHMNEAIFVREKKIKHSLYYPEKYWTVSERGKNFFSENEKKYASVELDYLPFNNCFNHGWSDLCGLMTKNDFYKYGNSISSSPQSIKGRDHTFMVINNKLETNRWIFCYRKESSLDCINYAKEKVISVDNIKNFLKVFNLMCAKIEGLKVE